jgi:hypothetical protein
MSEAIKTTHQNFPFNECFEKANEKAKAGAIIVQKWTCGGCGQRLYGSPGSWTKLGHCDDCNHTTNLVETGCNYLLAWASDRKGNAVLREMFDAAYGTTTRPRLH